MTDEQATQEETPRKLNFYKEIEFYSAGVAAWYSSSLEHDKSLLTLSSGGIALLITFVSGLNSYWLITLYVLAILSFIACLVSVLLIFKGNKDHIAKLINGDDFRNPYLDRLDGIAMWGFGLGVIFAAIIGISNAFQQYSKEKVMSDEKPKVTRGIAMDSFSGAQLLQKSFTNAHQLKPQATSGIAANPTSQSNTQQPATSAQQKPSAAGINTASSGKKD